MANLSSGDITNCLMQGYNPRFYEGLWERYQKAFGESFPDGLRPVSFAPGKFPDFPDLTPQYKEIGVSSKIQTVQMLMAAELLGSSPEPEFPKLDMWTATVRQQYLMDRSLGGGDLDGEWSAQHACVLFDGDGFGVAASQLGLIQNADGTHQTDLRHIPLVQLLWDGYCRSITRSRWMSSLNYMEIDQAFAVFGKKAVEDHRTRMRDTDGGSFALDVVRVFDFYHVGLPGKTDPTHAYILGDIDKDVIEIEANPYTELPFAVYEHFVLPGYKRANGRIASLIGDQEAINDAERHMRAAMKRVPFDVVDVEMVEEEDMKRVAEGDPNAWVRLKSGNLNENMPIKRFPGGEMSRSVIEFADRKERNFTINGGISDARQGVFGPRKETLGVNQLVDERGQNQIGFSGLELTRYYRRAFAKACVVGAIGDTAPLEVNIEGRIIVLNSKPGLEISQYLSQKTQIVVDEATLTGNAMAAEKAAKKASLNGYIPFVQFGLSPQWLMEEMLKIDGYDPQEALQASGGTPTMDPTADPAAALSQSQGASGLPAAV